MICKAFRSAFVFVVALLALSSVTVGAEEPVGILKIEITGLKDSTGNVHIGVYDSEETWLGDETVATRVVNIAEALNGEVVETEMQLPLGEYAFTLFYDADGDGEMKTNFIGMPKEPIAMSNNAKAKFGPPKFEDAVFNLGLEPTIQRVIITAL